MEARQMSRDFMGVVSMKTFYGRVNNEIDHLEVSGGGDICLTSVEATTHSLLSLFLRKPLQKPHW